jgi:hypothetical protein
VLLHLLELSPYGRAMRVLSQPPPGGPEKLRQWLGEQDRLKEEAEEMGDEDLDLILRAYLGLTYFEA